MRRSEVAVDRIRSRLRLGTPSRVNDQLMALPKGGQDDGSGPARCRSTSQLALPSARVGVGAELHDSTDSGILIFVAEDLLDRRERVLTAAVARCDPLNLVGIV